MKNNLRPAYQSEPACQQGRSAGRRVIGFFGLNSSITAMIIMVIFLGLGEKMAERFLPLYLIALGGSTFVVGFLNVITNLLNALYSFPGGWLSDRIGHKKALIVFTLIALCGYAIVIIYPVWQAVLVGAIFFISWTAVSLPAIMSLVAKTMPQDKRTMGVTVHSLVRRIPMALGPILGGLLIGYFGMVKGVRVAFGAAFILGVISIFIQWFFMADSKPKPNSCASYKSGWLIVRLLVPALFPKRAGALQPTIVGSIPLPVTGIPLRREKRNCQTKDFNPALRNLLVSDILIRFAEQIPYAFVVVWVVNNLSFSPFQFGILTTIEMGTAVLIYIPVAYFADRTTKKPFVIITFIFFTAFPLVLIFSKSFPLLILAFIIRGLKEFGEPTRKALIMDLAPEDAKAKTFGTYYLLRDIVVSLAALSSAYLWNISPETNFMVACGCGICGTIWFALFGKDLKSLKPSTPT
jgi:MFS family permease